MANIRGFEAPDLGLRPSEIGVESVAAAARRGGAFYNQAAEAQRQIGSEISSTISDVGRVADDYMTHRDISAGAAHGAEFMANMNSAWESTIKNADPNDQGVAAKFREQVLAPGLEQFQSGFSTERSQQWAEQFVDRYRNHMFEKTTADMSSLAGEAEKVNSLKAINGLASAVAIDPSMHSIDNALDQLKHSVGASVDSHSNIDAVTGAKIKGELGLKGTEQIVKAGIVSLIQKNPNADLDPFFQKYGDYLVPGEIKQFQKAQQSQQKLDASMARQAQIQERQIADLHVHADAGKIIADKLTFDPVTGSPIIDKSFFQDAQNIVKNNPNAPSAASTAEHMISWGRGEQTREQKITSDPATLNTLDNGMFRADKPTSSMDLMVAHRDNKISDHDFQTRLAIVKQLEQEPLKGPIWQDTVAAVKDDLVLSGIGLPGKDIKGMENYSKWAQTFIPEYLSLKRQNKLPANALDLKDPNSMISQSMAPFHRTIQERTNDYFTVLGAAPAGVSAAVRSEPANIPTVTTKDAFYALPKGAIYIGKDGQRYRKP